MSADGKVTPPDGREPSPSPAAGSASGKGSNTALEALIRQRKRAETPDDGALPPAPDPKQPRT